MPLTYCNTASTAALTNESAFPAGKIKHRMCRFEFFEAIIRVASRRFFESEETNSVPEALTKMIEEYIFADGKRDEWKDFRHKKLWTLEVDDTF